VLPLQGADPADDRGGAQQLFLPKLPESAAEGATGTAGETRFEARYV